MGELSILITNIFVYAMIGTSFYLHGYYGGLELNKVALEEYVSTHCLGENSVYPFVSKSGIVTSKTPIITITETPTIKIPVWAAGDKTE